MPPLRERKSDLPLLAQHLVTQLSERHKRPARFFSQAALEALRSHYWPGNVRELRNVVERAVIICSGEEIEDITSRLTVQHGRVRQEIQSQCPGTPIDRWKDR